MIFDELKEKALSLPLLPGVYLMRDKNNTVIYVGKAKRLKNRVSQYFQDTAAHSPKTRLMVSKIHHFEVIVSASEFEALVLECSLIKRYLPKYNILLKDDKGYPYLRLDEREEYPTIQMVSRPTNDGASYYGPYGSRHITQSVLEALRSTLKLPGCNKKFPRDIGRQRPCLNFHMHECEGWCRSEASHAHYRETIAQAKQLLCGNYKTVADQLRQQMLQASEELEFELAANIRDKLLSVEALGQRQLVTAGSLADTDVIGYAETETKACFAVLHYSGGNLLDKEYETFSLPEDKEVALSSLVKQYYLSKGIAPKVILLPFQIEDQELYAELLEKEFKKRVSIKVPRRGDNVRLVELAVSNAREEARRITGDDERFSASVALLGKMLAIPLPKRIEAFDISHISGTDIVASMVVFKDGKPYKSGYKRFKVENMNNQDDYASMHQVVRRRFAHYLSGDKGFDEGPDLVLIDGGINHAAIIERLMEELGLLIPVFGMVKDHKHRTRALVTADGREVAIDSQQSVFALIGNIQEETHRFAITYHKTLRSKRLKYSQLDQIPGVGPRRKQDLLKHFHSISGIREATLSELERILPKNVATAVYDHFKKE